MYNDIMLPDDEGWTAITTDLRQTKEARNALSKENSYVSLINLYGLDTMSFQATQTTYIRDRIGARRVCSVAELIVFADYLLPSWRNQLQARGPVP